MFITLQKTDEREFKGEGRIFGSIEEVEMVYSMDQVVVPTGIKLLTNTWYDDEGNRLAKPEERID